NAEPLRVLLAFCHKAVLCGALEELSLKSAARRLTGAIVTAAGLGLWLWVRGCCRKSLYCLATISWQVCHVGMVPTPDAKRSPAGPQKRKRCAQPRTFAKTARR